MATGRKQKTIRFRSETEAEFFQMFGARPRRRFSRQYRKEYVRYLEWTVSLISQRLRQLSTAMDGTELYTFDPNDYTN